MILYKHTRFNQLLESVEGINSKTLSLRLRQMEHDGLIKRKIFAETPIRIEYKFTEKGKTLKPILEQMGEFSTKYCPQDVFKDGKARTFDQVLESMQDNRQ